MHEDGLVVFLGTEDIERTHNFYHGVLGLQLYKDQGKCRIYRVKGGGKIGFCSHMEVVYKEKSPILTLAMEDVDGAYQKLKSQNIKISKPPTMNDYFKIYHFFLRDPDGYLLEIQRFVN